VFQTLNFAFLSCFPSPCAVPRNSTVLTRNAQESRAVDLQFEATAAWQYAIDPSTLKFVNRPPASGKLPSPVFDSNLPPLSITVTACPINWKVAGSTFAASPPTNPACTGAKKTITLTPYGVSAGGDHCSCLLSANFSLFSVDKAEDR
jgi:hypothetical protein